MSLPTPPLQSGPLQPLPPEAEPTGLVVEGTEVHAYTLASPSGVRLRVMTYGGIVLSLHAPDREGRTADVALGYASPEAYLDNPAHFGAIVGRYANRIAGGHYTEGGEEVQLDTNDDAHHIHGGDRGLDKVVWEAKPFAEAYARGVAFSYESPDGENGYPGTLSVRVTYTLTDLGEWIVDYHATTSRPTPVNLTQHVYLNLAGEGSVKGHTLKARAGQYVPVSADGIPLGGLASVEGTPFDFRKARALGEGLEGDHTQTEALEGYDHTLVFDDPRTEGEPAARLSDPGSGRVLTLFTTEPGVQLYTANNIDGIDGKHGRAYRAWDGVCLETQHFPDSPNRPDFPSTILHPGQTYASRTVYAFSTDGA